MSPEEAAPDATTLDAACGKAMDLQLAGRLAPAEQIYRGILRAEPRHAVANHCLGMLHVQMHRPAEGLPHLLAALESKPEISDYWLGYLEALLLVARTEDAKNTLALGRLHGLAGAAVDEFQNRLEARLRAEVPLVRAEEGALLALVQRGDFAAAIARARAATERFPEHGLAWKILGVLASTEGREEEALAALQAAARLMPQDAEAHVNLGMTLAKSARFAEAELHLHRALSIDPCSAAAHFRLGMTQELQGRFDEAEASLRRGLALSTERGAADEGLSYSNLLFLISHNPAVGADELFAEHCRFGEHFERPLRGSWPRHRNDRDPQRPLKVGLVSGDLYNHAVSSFIEPILAILSRRERVELHAYYNNTREDEVNRRLRGYFKGWRAVYGLPDLALANQITEDRIDILIDLSGHTGLNRLPVFARKPAPLQASWIGYPGTTGLRAMDYFLADPHFLPPGRFDRHFTEKLVHLPAQTPFQPHATAPPVNALPALAAGCITFGSFNRMGKINVATVGWWSQLLREVPEARMLIAGIALDGQESTLIDRFAAHGIGRERLTFYARCGMDSYLALYHQVDMCLDTTPYNGGTTTIHALWMGVPTLTIAGSTPAARSGAAILGQMGLHEFIAEGGAEFVAKGRYWADHLPALAAVRAGLRSRWQQSPDRRAEVIAGALEAALRRMWVRWCADLPAESFQITGSQSTN